METSIKFTKRQLLEMGFSVVAIKGLTPVDFVKAMKDGKPSRGRPAGLYSQEQVDSLKAGGSVQSTTESTEEPEAPDPGAASAQAVDAPVAGGTDLSEADFAQAA